MRLWFAHAPLASVRVHWQGLYEGFACQLEAATQTLSFMRSHSCHMLWPRVKDVMPLPKPGRVSLWHAHSSYRVR